MLPDPSPVALSPGASAAPEAGANPKQGLVLLETVRVPAGIRDPVTGAGQVRVLLSPHRHRRLLRGVRALRAQHPSGAKMLNLGSA